MRLDSMMEKIMRYRYTVEYIAVVVTVLLVIQIIEAVRAK